jgi:Mn-containing catalase
MEVLYLFRHEKQLLNNLQVKVEKPNPQYAVLMQEQLGGGNGELKAAMQYISQSFRIKDPTIKDLFLDIGTEELSHMEIVAETINLLNGHEVNHEAVGSGEIETHTLTGLAPVLINSSGAPWTADYVTVTGDLVADILSNIASEQRAKVVYEYLYRQINDKEVRNTIDFLLNREEAHNALFREALNKVKDTGSNKDFGVTEDSKLYFDLSTPGKYFDAPNPTEPSFANPRR